MIFAIYRSLFVLVVLEQIAIHANHIRHHHDSRLRHKFNVDDYVNDNFYNNLKSSVDTSAASEDEDYYDYMNDLENQEEEVAVGDDDAVRSRSHSNFYDYDKDNAYVSILLLLHFMVTGCERFHFISLLNGRSFGLLHIFCLWGFPDLVLVYCTTFFLYIFF